MRSFVTSKNVKWCHLIWPTLYLLTYLLTLNIYLIIELSNRVATNCSLYTYAHIHQNSSCYAIHPS